MRLLLALLTAILLILPVATRADDGPTIIRDTEIEDDLHEWTNTLIKAGGLNPDAVHFILVQDSEINSFVAGGQNIFMYTGLIAASDNADQVIGVIAHEMGHIRGGHLVRMQEEMKNASYESLLGVLLGGVAAAGTRNSGGVAAGALGGESTAMNLFLAFSRTQEASADQSALYTLQKACYSPKGLLDFMKKLEGQELLPESQQTAWMRTHPLTQDRVDAMQNGYDRSTCKDKQFPQKWEDEHDRIKAKLEAYIYPEHIKWDYPDSNQSIPAQYARAIAAYRLSHVDEALAGINALLKQEPQNPYFLELKGQMLTDFGHVGDALAPYQKSIEILGKAPLIRTAYANALIETSDQDRARLDQAIQQLVLAQRDEPRSSEILHLLATAWGRKGQEPMARLYLAEEAILDRKTSVARQDAEEALHGLKPGTQPYLMAQDILSYLNTDKQGKDKNAD